MTQPIAQQNSPAATSGMLPTSTVNVASPKNTAPATKARNAISPPLRVNVYLLNPRMISTNTTMAATTRMVISMGSPPSDC
jgi:hypothetical protein